MYKDGRTGLQEYTAWEMTPHTKNRKGDKPPGVEPVLPGVKVFFGQTKSPCSFFLFGNGLIGQVWVFFGAVAVVFLSYAPNPYQ